MTIPQGFVYLHELRGTPPLDGQLRFAVVLEACSFWNPRCPMRIISAYGCLIILSLYQSAHRQRREMVDRFHT